MAGQRPTDNAQPKRWFPVQNQHNTAAPAFGVALVTGVNNTDGTVTVTRPNAANIDGGLLVVLDGAGMAANEYGQATRDMPWWAAVNTTLAFGDSVGTVTNSWNLAAGSAGFVVWATDDDDESALVVSAGGGGGCDAPGDPPAGWTAGNTSCYQDFTEARCTNTNTTEYRNVRLHLVNGQFLPWYGTWNTTNPPPTP